MNVSEETRSWILWTLYYIVLLILCLISETPWVGTTLFLDQLEIQASLDNMQPICCVARYISMKRWQDIHDKIIDSILSLFWSCLLIQYLHYHLPHLLSDSKAYILILPYLNVIIVTFNFRFKPQLPLIYFILLPSI